MKLLNRLFRRPFTFGNDISNFVNVMDSAKRDQRCDDLFCGMITSVDFNKREVVIVSNKTSEYEQGTHVVGFDSIVTISRMKDGRLRMWIKVEGQA